MKEEKVKEKIIILMKMTMFTLKPLSGQNIDDLQVNQGIKKLPSLASVNLQECKSNRLI